MVLEGCSQVAETCHPLLALEVWKQQQSREVCVILPCRFSAAEDVLDFPGERGGKLQTCLSERRVLGEEDRGV